MTEGIRTGQQEEEARTGIHFARIEEETKEMNEVDHSKEVRGSLMTATMEKKDHTAAQEVLEEMIEETVVKEVSVKKKESHAVEIISETTENRIEAAKVSEAIKEMIERGRILAEAISVRLIATINKSTVDLDATTQEETTGIHEEIRIAAEKAVSIEINRATEEIPATRATAMTVTKGKSAKDHAPAKPTKMIKRCLAIGAAKGLQLP